MGARGAIAHVPTHPCTPSKSKMGVGRGGKKGREVMPSPIGVREWKGGCAVSSGRVRKASEKHTAAPARHAKNPAARACDEKQVNKL